MKESNLLQSRKTCVKRQLEISDVVRVSTTIVSFGQFTSGQNLGNEIVITNKTDQEQTFALSLDNEEFAETVSDLLAPFCPEDLPFSVTSNKAVNSQKKFNCWMIENPTNRTLVKSIVFALTPHQIQSFVIVVKAPM